MGQPGFFDLDECYQRLSENGGTLVKLAALIEFEAFRPKLATALERSNGSKSGRPPYDPVLTFKILILQTLDTLSDDATEFQIRDKLSFMRFLGLGFEDAVPDAKTVWLFREHLTRAGAIDALFAAFDAWLKGKGYLAMSGQIIDASIFVLARLNGPGQRTPSGPAAISAAPTSRKDDRTRPIVRSAQLYPCRAGAVQR
jgi:IS5 family transposase